MRQKLWKWLWDDKSDKPDHLEGIWLTKPPFWSLFGHFLKLKNFLTSNFCIFSVLTETLTQFFSWAKTADLAEFWSGVRIQNISVLFPIVFDVKVVTNYVSWGNFVKLLQKFEKFPWNDRLSKLWLC
jgi:hypothetical protein